MLNTLFITRPSDGNINRYTITCPNKKVLEVDMTNEVNQRVVVYLCGKISFELGETVMVYVSSDLWMFLLVLYPKAI